MSFIPINQDMDSVITELTLKTNELNEAYSTLLDLDANYDRNFASALLTAKVTDKNKTQSEIASIATETAFIWLQELNKGKSTHHRLINEIKVLYARLDVLKEKGYNLRREYTDGRG